MSNPYSIYGVSDEAASLALKAGEAVLPVFRKIEETREKNQLRVMEAFRAAKFSEPHMGLTTGYGYDDIGREKIEQIFADIMGAPKAYVRIQISSGTQAISSMLYGITRPGDVILSATGKPYDTLASTLGLTETSSRSPEATRADARFARTISRTSAMRFIISVPISSWRWITATASSRRMRSPVPTAPISAQVP